MKKDNATLAREMFPVAELERLFAMGLEIFPTAATKSPLVTWQTVWAKDLDSWYKLVTDCLDHDLPVAGVGARIPADVVVVDLDVKGDKNGVSAWQTACAGVGTDPMPRTLVTRTRSDGRHIWLKSPDGVTIGQGVDVAGLVGVDTRVAGRGFVMVPPSPGYEFHGSESSFAPMDPKIGKVLAGKRPSNENSERPSGDGYEPKDHVPEGGRDHEMTRYAGWLRQGGCAEWLMVRLMHEYNDKAFSPPLRARDILRIAGSIGKKDPGEAIHAAEERKERAGSTYGLNYLEYIGDEEPDTNDLYDWAIQGIIPRAVPCVIAGDPKTGKTMLMESLALALVTGKKHWCEMIIPDDMRGCRVLVMPKEDSPRTTKIRLWQLARGFGVDIRTLGDKLVIDDAPLFLDDAAYVSKLRNTLKTVDVALIDSLSTVHMSDENLASSMNPIVETWRQLALETNTSVCLVHHYGGKGNPEDKRSPGNRMRGSSAIFAGVRHVVGVERYKDQNQVLAIRTSGNLFYQPEPFVVRLDRSDTETGRALSYQRLGTVEELNQEAEVVFESDSPPDEVIILQALDRAGGSVLNRKALVKLSGLSDTRVKKALEALLDAKTIIRYTDGRIERVGW